MLRCTGSRLKIQSHQITFTRNKTKGKRYGKEQTPALRRYGLSGFGGSGLMSPGKFMKRIPLLGTGNPPLSPEKSKSPLPLGQDAHTTLSPLWSPYALADGGVLFTHPSSRQVLQWTRTTLANEGSTATGGMNTAAHETDKKLDRVINHNGVENVTVDMYRRNFVSQMVRRKVKRQAPLTSTYTQKEKVSYAAPS